MQQHGIPIMAIQSWCVYDQEDWGELYTGKKAPAIFVLDVGSWAVQQVKGLPTDTSFGQAVWAPDGKTSSNFVDEIRMIPVCVHLLTSGSTMSHASALEQSAALSSLARMS
jgi:hypothetical protein